MTLWKGNDMGKYSESIKNLKEIVETFRLEKMNEDIKNMEELLKYYQSSYIKPKEIDNTFYILHVRDSEDNFLYLTLLFKDEDTREEACSLIENFNAEWYANEISPDEDLGWSYIEYLEHMLEKHDMLKYSVNQDTIYIR